MGDVHPDEFGSQPIPRVVQEKLDQLRLYGCNQLISWSKLGCIAYVTPDGTGVETRHIMCNPKDGKWILTEGYPVHHVARAHDGQQIAHISWNAMGTELAIIDIFGRVSFSAVYMSVNVLQCYQAQFTDPEDDLGGLAGFWWMNTDKQYAVFRPAVNDEKGWRYPAVQQKNLPPYHPQSKTACLGLTRGGTLKLYYQGDQNRFFESTQELEGCMSLEDLYSHASFSSDKDNTVILAAYTLSKKLRIYRISIDWNMLPQANPQQLSVPPSNVRLIVKRLKVENLASPAEVSNMDMSKAFLTHLEVMPPTFSGPNVHQYFPTTILAIYSVMNMLTPSSVIVRWVLRETQGSLHPSFDQLGVRRGSVSTPNTKEFELHRIPEDLLIDNVIIGVTHLQYCVDIKFACIDGSVQTRDRSNLKLFTPHPNNYHECSANVVFNMVHAGFDFPAPAPGDIYTGLSLSPNGTVMVVSLPDGSIKMIPMEYQRGPLDPKMNFANFTAATAAFAHIHASGCNNMVNNDDVLMVIRPLRSDFFNKVLITEVHKALSLKMDFTPETPNERLFRNPVLQRSLSLQTSIYNEGENAPMRLEAKLAWIFLHLRIASLGFGTTINTLQRGEELKIESIHPLLGISRWSMDLIAFIVDDIFQLARSVGDRVNDREYVRSIAVKTNSPAIFVLLCSGTRVLTRYNSRGLRQTENTTAAHINAQQTLLHMGTQAEQNHLQILRSLKAIFDASPVRLLQFEKMIGEVSTACSAAYHTLTEVERLTCEREIFINNDIPIVLGPAVEKLLRDAQALMKSEMDLANLYFHDLSWLGLDDDIKSIAARRSRKLDSIRKTEIAEGRPLRQCTRCCSVTEDFTTSRQMSNWLVSLQRMCFCGSLWMVKN
ncbi:hypothetical protein L211DRAFT_818153 [Terfezia boudieri ATCC MYA-4762]|uniref:Mediator of RNA polymerase II transcription subunit 16 n=1 Tax=Terfezia boudieri ATCC MYA-4762 TaxID=1051890 RepID=A0A3N4LZX4_9PEZI|nr:hypothetical protein L211DRAFT_818153 [Terfezia boudieri ATCC MYA-4762]